MYLKKIEIAGFKSFTNKTTFDFHNGITAIVGPNGSGKSNVSDAVRWVLGEQSAKQLRGSNMQDVIFAGTMHKKPWSYASVSITFDNSDKALDIDFDEVVVTRKIYRSGESEYLLNSSNVRLKDITELFFDTGIGKDGYSIIGQGQVDKLLSSRADERRELFDEAVGITKLKNRKDASIKKLNAQENNLIRISDVLSELKKQIPGLSSQAENAKKYLQLRDELKNAEANIFSIKSANINKEIEELEKKEKISDERYEEANQELAKVKKEYEDFIDEYNECNELVKSKNNDLSNLKIAENNLLNEIRIIEEKIINYNNGKNIISANIDRIKKEIKDNEEAVYDYENKLADLKNNLLLKSNRSDEIINNSIILKKEISELEEKIAKINEDKMKSLDIKGDLNARIKAIDELITQNKLRISDIENILLENKAKTENLKNDLNFSENELSKCEKYINESNEKFKDASSLRNRLIEQKESINKLLSELSNEYQYEEAKLESLRNIAERYDGYGIAIKKIMEVRDRFVGISGVLADVISVDKKYELAVETVLGSRLQNIVTQTQEEAKTLIEYLKKNKFGRATFLPLDANLKIPYIKDRTVLKEHGVIATADNLVECDEIYKELIKSLVGNVLVMDNVENAIKLAKKTDNEYRIVTLDGELFFVGGAMSGGAYKNSSNLLGRNREIEELEESIRKKVIQVDELNNRLSSCNNELRACEEDIENLKSKINKAELDKSNYLTDSTHIKNRIDELADSVSLLNIEHSNKLKVIEDAQLKKNKFILELDEIDDTSSNKEFNEKFSAKLSDLKRDYEQNIEIERNMELDILSLKRDIDYSAENIENLKKKNEILSQEINKLQLDFKAGEDKLVEYKASIDENKKAIDDNLINQDSIKVQLEEIEIKHGKYKSSQEKLFKLIEDITADINNIEKEKIRISSSKERVEEEFNDMVSYMWDEYQLNLLDVKNIQLDSNISMSDLRKNVVKIKNSVKSLGSINIDAIEQFREVNERYEHIKTQYDDITEAKEKLINIIKELDDGMEEMFKKGFADISREFDSVFKELFGGGSAKLVLEDDDILNTDISIISQPPGKKLQNMMQLSGGEKALTAISLLFAIQKLKPSPFVLLDEIEAALDDSNVTRFADYLNKLSLNTQFIVITHRRGTMLGSDRLYGITMKEKGISTMVSVDLIENELDK